LLHQGKVCSDQLRMKYAIPYLTAWQIGSLLWPNATLHGHAKLLRAGFTLQKSRNRSA
jgi:DNA-binding helix-hairpin-helix protein with protein kinase domain